MELFSYETVASVCSTVSLLLFIAIFLIMLVYVFGFTNREKLDAAQKSALDLGSDKNLRGNS